jgi:hypothetical protein
VKKLIVVISSVVVLNGCYYDVADELYPESAPCDTTVKGFAAKISPIMTNNCAIPGCHVPGVQTPDLTDYSNIAANSATIKQRAVIIKDMPPTGPLSSCDIHALEQWIDNGSLNN